MKRFGEAAGSDQLIPIARLVPSPLNPRADEEDLTELCASIHAQGVLQNLVVRPMADGSGNFEIMAGSRRRAACARLIAGGFLPAELELRCVVREATDDELLEIALVENLNREDLSPVDEGRAYLQRYEAILADRGAMAAAEFVKRIAANIGRTPRYVQWRMQVVRNLPDAQRAALSSGAINLTTARALVQKPERQRVTSQNNLQQVPITLSLTEDEVEALIELTKVEKSTIPQIVGGWVRERLRVHLKRRSA